MKLLNYEVPSIEELELEAENYCFTGSSHEQDMNPENWGDF